MHNVKKMYVLITIVYDTPIQMSGYDELVRSTCVSRHQPINMLQMSGKNKTYRNPSVLEKYDPDDKWHFNYEEFCMCVKMAKRKIINTISERINFKFEDSSIELGQIQS